LAVEDRVEAGWIHDPLGGETIVAMRGGGAWRGGERLSIAAPAAGDAVIGSVSKKYMRSDERRWADGVCAAFPAARSLFCAGAEYSAIATGARQFAAFRRLMPWDHAAGALIVTEAGGESALAPDRAPYRPSLLDGSLLTAASPALWTAIAAAGARGAAA